MTGDFTAGLKSQSPTVTAFCLHDNSSISSLTDRGEVGMKGQMWDSQQSNAGYQRNKDQHLNGLFLPGTSYHCAPLVMPSSKISSSELGQLG